jgi:hypothetical protein
VARSEPTAMICTQRSYIARPSSSPVCFAVELDDPSDAAEGCRALEVKNSAYRDWGFRQG